MNSLISQYEFALFTSFILLSFFISFQKSIKFCICFLWNGLLLGITILQSIGFLLYRELDLLTLYKVIL